MNRSLLLVIALAVALASVVLLLRSDSEGEGGAATIHADGDRIPEASAVEPTAIVHSASGQRTAIEPSGGDLAAESALANPTAGGDPAFEVTGRVLGSAGEPLAGVTVSLTAGGGLGDPPTAGELAVARAAGLATESADDGSFRIDGALPDADAFRLQIDGGEFRMTFQRILSDVEGRNELYLPALVEGANDLGELIVREAGAIVGRVTDSDGSPVEGARVHLGTSHVAFRFEAMHVAQTDAGGFYRLAQQPVGAQPYTFYREGYVPLTVKDVAVDAGAVTEDVDGVLARAHAYTGRVADVDGAPIEGARLSAAADRARSSGSGRTGADGSFTVYVPASLPHRFEVSKPGYTTLGVLRTGELFDLAASPLEFVLEPATRIEFHVVDARTGEPLERFALFVVEGMGSGSDPRASRSISGSPRPYPGGVVEEEGRPLFDAVTVDAPGYERFRGDIAYDEPGSGVQTIALEPLLRRSIAGRVVDGSEPVAGLRVELVGLRPFDAGQSGVPDLPGHRIEPPTEDQSYLVEGFGNPATVTTDDGGRFVFEHVEHEACRIVAHHVGRQASAEVVHPIDGEIVDLGDLPLEAFARLEGRVLLDGEIAGAALAVLVDGRRRGTTVASDGTFTIDDLLPGRHAIGLEEVGGVLDPPDPRIVHAAAGETESVQIDLRGQRLRRVPLRVLVGGQPWVNVKVALYRGDVGPLDLGATDGDGRVVGFAPPVGPCTVAVKVANSPWVPHPTARVEPGGESQELDFRLATLEIRIPEAVDLGAVEIVRVGVQPAVSPWPPEEIVSIQPQLGADRSLSLFGFAPGDHRLEIAVEARPTPGTFERVPLWESGPIDVVLVAGERTTVGGD